MGDGKTDPKDLKARAFFFSAAGLQQIAPCQQRRNPHPVGRALHVRETCIIMHTKWAFFGETAL